MHCKEDVSRRWRLYACAGLIILGSAAFMCFWAEAAVADDTSLRAAFPEGGDNRPIRVYKRRIRHPKQGEHKAVLNEDGSEAKHFAARLKHHQQRHFSQRRREFRKQQRRLEAQRRLRKAKLKASQFAEARRRATQHAPRRKQMHMNSEGGI